MCLHFSFFLNCFRKSKKKIGRKRKEKYEYLLGTCKYCGKRRYLKGKNKKKWGESYQKPLLEISNVKCEDICVECYYRNL